MFLRWFVLVGIPPRPFPPPRFTSFVGSSTALRESPKNKNGDSVHRVAALMLRDPLKGRERTLHNRQTAQNGLKKHSLSNLRMLPCQEIQLVCNVDQFTALDLRAPLSKPARELVRVQL